MADQLGTDFPVIRDVRDEPLAGGSVEFFQSGTSTPLTVYTDADLTTPAGSSVTLDSAGRHVQVFVSEGVAVRAVHKDAEGTTIRTIDPAGRLLVASSGAGQVSYSATELNPASTVQDAIDNASTSASEAQGAADEAQSTADNASTIINALTQSLGVAKFAVNTETIANNAAADFRIPTGCEQGVAFVFVNDTDIPRPQFAGATIYTAGSGTRDNTPLGGGGNFTTVNTSVNGATGSVGDLTVGIKTNDVPVENQTGAERNVTVVMIGVPNA